MSMCAEAMLCYGIPFNEDELPDGVRDKAYDYESELQAIALPQPPYNRDGKPLGLQWDEWRRKLFVEYRPQSVTMRKAGHCDNSEVVFIFVQESMTRVEWDEIATIESLAIKPEWRAKLSEYCSGLGLPWYEPRWFLSAFYG